MASCLPRMLRGGQLCLLVYLLACLFSLVQKSHAAFVLRSTIHDTPLSILVCVLCHKSTCRVKGLMECDFSLFSDDCVNLKTVSLPFFVHGSICKPAFGDQNGIIHSDASILLDWVSSTQPFEKKMNRFDL